MHWQEVTMVLASFLGAAIGKRIEWEQIKAYVAAAIGAHEKARHNVAP